ncbi:MAG TPA: hypothetical protein H9923_00630 [Candidatus Dwaynia gallinarum]|nr:hypothetical protein [Candidatus Dwaynia gallinarum]
MKNQKQVFIVKSKYSTSRVATDVFVNLIIKDEKKNKVNNMPLDNKQNKLYNKDKLEIDFLVPDLKEE